MLQTITRFIHSLPRHIMQSLRFFKLRNRWADFLLVLLLPCLYIGERLKLDAVQSILICASGLTALISVFPLMWQHRDRLWAYITTGIVFTFFYSLLRWYSTPEVNQILYSMTGRPPTSFPHTAEYLFLIFMAANAIVPFFALGLYWMIFLIMLWGLTHQWVTTSTRPVMRIPLARKLLALLSIDVMDPPIPGPASLILYVSRGFAIIAVVAGFFQVLKLPYTLTYLNQSLDSILYAEYLKPEHCKVKLPDGYRVLFTDDEKWSVAKLNAGQYSFLNTIDCGKSP